MRLRGDAALFRGLEGRAALRRRPHKGESNLEDLLAKIPGDVFFLDVPSVHEDAVAIANDLAMESVFETARTCTRGRPAFSLERCYGVTTFEFG